MFDILVNNNKHLSPRDIIGSGFKLRLHSSGDDLYNAFAFL